MDNRKNLRFAVALLAVAGFGYLFDLFSIWVAGFMVFLACCMILLSVFSKLSNRIVTFFILLFIVVTLVYLVYHFFIGNVGTVVVELNGTKGVSAVLKGEFQNSYEQKCEETCIFKRVPPVEYMLTLKKEGYRDVERSISLKRSEALKISVIMKKEITVSEFTIGGKNEAISRKYRRLVDSAFQDGKSPQKTTIGFFQSRLYSYSNDRDFRIYAYDGEKETLLYSLEAKTAESVFLNRVDGLISFLSGSDNFFYDIDTSKIYSPSIGSKITLAKKTLILKYYIVRSSDGVYLYNTNTNEVVKNVLFDDFVLAAEGKVIGLISPQSKNKLALLNIPDDFKYKLILHDIPTKSRKVIYSTQQPFDTLYYRAGQLYGEEADKDKGGVGGGNIFKINQIDLK